jgi:hypothetical protein
MVSAPQSLWPPLEPSDPFSLGAAARDSAASIPIAALKRRAKKVVAEKKAEEHPLAKRPQWMPLVLSLGLHGVLLGCLALQIIQFSEAKPAGEVFVETSDDGGGAGSGGLGDIVSFDMQPWMPAGGQGAPPETATAVSAVALGDIGLPGIGKGTGIGTGNGAGDGTGGAGGGGGLFPGLPKNAVQKGSFAAWITPQGIDNVHRRFRPVGEPGESPQQGEVYHITIRIRLPNDRVTYSISDLSGEVVGTDKYRQRIPDRAYIRDKEGNLVRPSRVSTIKVKNHIAEIIFEVPGADEFVEDTIQVESTLLKESQTLTLKFGE